ATWELKPTLSVFSEVAINQRNYDTAAATDLINRSSDGARYRAGLSFGNTGQILRGEVSLGYGVQAPDDERLSAIDGLIFDANATWRPAELTSVLLTARSDVSETTTAGVGGSFARSAGIEVRHSVRKYLIASAGLTYSTQNSEDGTINEGELRSTLGLEYFLNRDAILYGRYAHASFDAVGSASDYESDEVHLGLRIRR
ncbi:MAG: outer membrane beta-barrel protein, partial [Hyphomicrobium sp.]